MKKTRVNWLTIVLIMLIIVGIIALFGLPNKNKTEPEIISHFPEKPAEPTQNQSSSEGIMLGQKLFFDAGLSPKKVSCGSCHPAAGSFASPIAVGQSQRDILPLFNLAWRRSFFWDGGGKNLESAVFGPLRHPDEMAAELSTIGSRLGKQPDYKRAFKAVFDTDTILPAHLARALAQYIRSLISNTSPYDAYLHGNGGALSQSQIKGLNIFMQKCNSCHTSPLFASDTFFRLLPDPNNLKNASPDAPELGRYRISGAEIDKYAYRAPSLRNLVFTAPYMHDGRFKTINQVLDFYQKSSPFAKSNNYITNTEKLYLHDFLIGLTDSSFVNKHAYKTD